MNWFGMKYGNFELEHGDFLSPKYRELITQEATIIFINNYAFQSDLETRILRELLVELKHGTKIISTKPYVPVKGRVGIMRTAKINERPLAGTLRGSSREGSVSEREVQKDNFSVIVDIFELNRCTNPPCSWTSAYVPYYLQVINRTKVWVRNAGEYRTIISCAKSLARALLRKQKEGQERWKQAILHAIIVQSVCL